MEKLPIGKVSRNESIGRSTSCAASQERAAAASAGLPGVPSEYQTGLQFTEGEQDPARKMVAQSRFVSPDYFTTVRIPLLSGEFCREPKFASALADPTGVRRTELNSIHVLVNRSFADTYSARSTIIGRHLQAVGNSFLRPNDAGEIRGIVSDARRKVNHQPSPHCVGASASSGGPDPYYLVRTRGEPMAMVETIRQKIHEIEPTRFGLRYYAARRGTSTKRLRRIVFALSC
jgi:hypothetical protein